MKKLFAYLILTTFLFNWNPYCAFAFHIVGGELTYECMGGNNYRIDLTFYRDCLSNGADFDNPAYIFIFEETDLVSTLSIPFPGSEEVEPPDDICLETLPDVCVEKTVYSTITSIPPSTNGYTLVYQRYSRNSTIVNLFLPDETGLSFTAEIPSSNLAICNSSPEFTTFPPTVICAGAPLNISQAAFDADGDSLVYELCTPLTGGSDFCPQPGSFDNCSPAAAPAPPPPYGVVDFIPPYSGVNPLGGSPQVVIDPITGLLTGTPTATGQYVVGICVTEFRDGIAINTIRRDFQFNVTNCEVINAAVISDDINEDGEFIITDCGLDFEVDFINNSSGATSYDWDFGDLTTTTDISTLANPTYEYPDTGSYRATLIAYSDFANCIDTAIIIVNVYPTHLSDFSFVADCAYVPVVFTDLSTTTYGEVSTWTWNFDGEGISTEQNPEFTFANGGVKEVSLTTTTDLGCVNTFTTNVDVIPVPIAEFETTLRCPGLPIEFTDISSNANVVSWSWDFGDPNVSPEDNVSDLQNPTHIYTDDGFYTVSLEVESDEGCVDDWSLSFTIYPEFIAEAGVDTAMCVGDVIQLAASTEFDFFSYEWAPQDGSIIANETSFNPSVSPSTTTTYTVTISDPNGCTDTDQVTVVVHPLPVVKIVGNDTICLGESVTLQGDLSANLMGFEWTGSDGFTNNTDQSITVSPTENTTYVLQATDVNGCINSDTILVIVEQPVVANINTDLAICQGDTTQLNASGSDFYEWSPAEGLSNPNVANPLASPLSTTTYTVTVSNTCFSDIQNVTVTVNSLPLVDAGTGATVNVGETVMLNADAEGIYNWSPTDFLSDPNSAMPIAQPLDTITYYLTATDANGCSNTDSITINVTRLFDVLIPNAFSPNGDGVNDLFGIVNSRGLETLQEFSVYNRWGQQVFNSSGDFDRAWNGIRKGVDQEMGVYVYYIKAITFLGDEFEQKGNVTLIR